MKRSSLFKSNPTRLTLGGIALLACATSSSAAVTWKDIQFGGFASQGYITNTGDNDYLGDTSDGTFDFREYAANASWSKGKFRIGAQAFGQKLGEYGDDKIKLDWALVDYQATQWFGIRAGRVKTPRGLYNEALDIDSVRPFVLLPQSVYDARLRDFNAAFNGAMIYGNVSLKSFGSLDYRAYYGDIPMSIDSGASDYFNNDVPFANLSIGMDSVAGGTLFWNTPVNGLRTGYSVAVFNEFSADRRAILPGLDAIFYKTASAYERHLLSVEYTTGDWVLAAEAGQERAVYDVGFPGSAPINFLDFRSNYGYVSVARRLNTWLELGTYVSTSRDKQNSRIAAAVSMPTLEQTDYAVSAKFDINQNVIFKLEGHYLNGSGKLFDTPAKPQPVPNRDNSWTMLTAKVTFSF